MAALSASASGMPVARRVGRLARDGLSRAPPRTADVATPAAAWEEGAAIADGGGGDAPALASTDDDAVNSCTSSLADATGER